MESKKVNEIKVVADASSVGNSVVNNAFKNWSQQFWFKSLFCVIVLCLLGVFIQVSVTKSVTRSINKSMDEREEIQKVEHTNNFQLSKHAYADAKRTMTNYIDDIDCDYLFLLEYHNGSENIVTGLQFCKFDITLEIAKECVEDVPLIKFKDDIIARYNILLSDEMDENKVIVKDIETLKKEDPYLYYQLKSVDAKKIALFNLKDKHSLIYASLLGVSVSNNHIDETKMILCSRVLENILNLNEK